VGDNAPEAVNIEAKGSLDVRHVEEGNGLFDVRRNRGISRHHATPSASGVA
jgi:hypothetical protein